MKKTAATSNRAESGLEKIGLKDFYLRNKLKVATLALLTALVYLGSLTGDFISDDRLSVLYDPTVSNLARPYNFTSLSGFLLSLNYRMGGPHPEIFHLTSLLIHLGVTFLGYYLIYRLMDEEIAFLATLIFSVHPLNSEAVSWISGRIYPLYSLFLLLGLYLYLEARRAKNRALSLFLSLVSFLVGLTANLFALSFPFFIALFELAFGNLKKNWPRVLLFFLVASVSAFLLSRSIAFRVSYVSQISQRGGSLEQALFLPFVSLWHYPLAFFFPKNLSFYHEDLSFSYSWRYPLVLLSLFLFASLPFLYKRFRRIFFGLVFYIAAISPSLTPFHVSWVIAERYSYLGNLGLSLVLAELIYRLSNSGRWKNLEASLILLLLFAFSARTVVRNLDWKNEDSLWLATSLTSPGSSRAWNNMGDYYGKRGDLDSSLKAFVRATELNPTYADAWHNAGNALIKMGRYEESIAYFEKSLEFNPNLTEAYNNLARVYSKLKETEKWPAMIKKSLAINPNSIVTYSVWASLAYEEGDYLSAKKAVQTALKLDPNNPLLQQNLALIESKISNR